MGPAAAGKAYVIDVPVYAAPEGTAQAAWNAVTHKFSITDPAGTSKTYEVLQNMANPASAEAKIYPNTGVSDADGSTYFPTNTWGFGVTPRNLKQYNYQMLLDSLVWNNYSVRAVGVKFTPLMGANQPGFFEAVLLNNAQILPAAPFTNQTNSVSFSATQEGAFSFKINNEVSPVKNMKAIGATFDATADFGLLWFRCAGFSNLAGITEVGKLQIRVDTQLSNYSPSPYAQLIGPWIEAGYPISGGGGVVVQTRSSTTGSQMLGVDSKSNASDRARIERGREAKPRWFIIPAEKDKHLVDLGGVGGVGCLREMKRIHARKLGQNADPELTFPMIAQTGFDAAISGRTFLNDVVASNTPSDVHRVSDAFFPLVEDESLYAPGLEREILPGTIEAGQTRLQLAFYPDQSASNSFSLAQGGVGVKYVGPDVLGRRVGSTLLFTASFAPGAAPVAGDLADAPFQVAAGYEPGLGNTAPGAIEDTQGGVGWSVGGFIKTAVAVAGAFLNGPGNSGNGLLVALSAANASNAGNTRTNKGVLGLRGGSNETITVQSSSFAVPDAGYRSVIAEWPAGSIEQTFAEAFYPSLPLAAKYGLVTFNPDKLTNDMERLTVVGQCNTLHTAILALEGSLPADASGLSYDTTIAESLVLVASRVDPAADPSGFLESAIPITPMVDSVARAGGSKSMFINAVSGPGGRFVLSRTTVSGERIREQNTNVGAFALSQVLSPNVCNFTVAFPKSLWDPESERLTDVKPGERIFLSFFKSSAVTYSHTSVETVGSFVFWAFPNLAPGTDKASADQAGRLYTLAQSPENPLKITGITAGGPLAESIYMTEDAERRFSVEATTPVSAPAPGSGSGGLSAIRVVATPVH